MGRAKLNRVAVVGCGLIGGSIVKALRDRTEAKVAAIDNDAVLRAAGAWLDDSAPPGSDHALNLVAGADVTVLAVPVGAIVTSLPWVLEALGADGVATDTGSVKRSIVSAAGAHRRGDRFVGGHPMTGREMGGFEASSADLFDGSRWFLVQDGPRGAVSERVADLVRALGAVPVSIDARVHDRAMAYASHAPQLIASALVAVGGRAGVLGDAGPGFRDLTRIAGGPTGVWRDIVAENRFEIASALADILGPLDAVRDRLASSGEQGVDLALSMLDEARRAIDQAPVTWAPNGKDRE